MFARITAWWKKKKAEWTRLTEERRLEYERQQEVERFAQEQRALILGKIYGAIQRTGYIGEYIRHWPSLSGDGIPSLSYEGPREYIYCGHIVEWQARGDYAVVRVHRGPKRYCLYGYCQDDEFQFVDLAKERVLCRIQAPGCIDYWRSELEDKTIRLTICHDADSQFRDAFSCWKLEIDAPAACVKIDRQAEEQINMARYGVPC